MTELREQGTTTMFYSPILRSIEQRSGNKVPLLLRQSGDSIHIKLRISYRINNKCSLLPL